MKNSILGSILLTFFLALVACNNNKKHCEGAGAMGDSTKTCCKRGEEKACCKKAEMKACCKMDSTGTCMHDSTTCAQSDACGKHHGGACNPEKEGCCKKDKDHDHEVGMGEHHEGKGKACCKKKE